MSNWLSPCYSVFCQTPVYIAVNVFFRYDQHLNQKTWRKADYPPQDRGVRQGSSGAGRGCTQSVKSLKRKDWGSPRKKQFRFQISFATETATSTLPWFFSLLAYATDFRFASSTISRINSLKSINLFPFLHVVKHAHTSFWFFFSEEF